MLFDIHYNSLFHKSQHLRRDNPYNHQPGSIFRKQDYDSMVNRIRETLETKGQISLAEVRDLFDTSRKYAQALLEHLDATGVTVRAGDFRKLRK